MHKKNAGQVEFPADTVIFHEGDWGDSAYFIKSGFVEISVMRSGEKVVLAVRGAGEIFGEMAIIDNQNRSARATALENCSLIAISKEQLAKRVADLDPVLRMCIDVVLTRFRETLAQTQKGSLNALAGHMSDRESVDRQANLHQRALEDIKLEHDLALALIDQQFELHFQPIVDLKSGRLEGFESLVRWHHPVKGLVSPNDFIPAAERNGQITSLTFWCLRRAAEAAKGFLSTLAKTGKNHEAFFVSVNISGRDLNTPNFVDHLSVILQETRINPSRLKLEITETFLMGNPDAASRVLNECKELGVGIAIDDFGTGHSSLSYLHKFPIDTLKVDRSFIASMLTNETSREIVSTVANLGRNLKLVVVGEGIEQHEDAVLLRSLGYSHGQGFYFAKPMPENEAVALLQNGSDFMEDGDRTVTPLKTTANKRLRSTG